MVGNSTNDITLPPIHQQNLRNKEISSTLLFQGVNCTYMLPALAMNMSMGELYDVNNVVTSQDCFGNSLFECSISKRKQLSELE